MASLSHIVVIGAGAFGGWTALNLLRQGVRVTLVDAWGPGHSRSSSGGTTRIIRATYGTRAVYTRMAAEAMPMWVEFDRQWRTHLFRRTGALWMSGGPDRFAVDSEATLRTSGIPVESLGVSEAGRRFPQVNFDGIHTVLFEPEAGYVLARRACEEVVRRVVAEGAEYRMVAVRSPFELDGSAGGNTVIVRLNDGTSIEADGCVAACGPWLGQLFPDVIGPLITPTRQETYYFGRPPGDVAHGDTALPVWLDMTGPVLYGIPGHDTVGFKIGDDTSGAEIDPSTEDRSATPERVEAARRYVAHRFPGLAGAPFLGAEVCQYEATPDSDFIIDRHPEASRLWLVGGGSGHGFKMGPLIGQMVARAVLDLDVPPDLFRLRRFGTGGTPPAKWN